MIKKEDLKIGDTYEIIGNRAPRHYFEIGEKVKFTGLDKDGDAMFEHLDGSDFWWVGLHDVSRA